MVLLIKPFRGVPKGLIYPVQFQAGDECPAELEHAAHSVGALAVRAESGGDNAPPPADPGAATGNIVQLSAGEGGAPAAVSGGEGEAAAAEASGVETVSETGGGDGAIAGEESKVEADTDTEGDQAAGPEGGQDKPAARRGRPPRDKA